MQRATRSNGSKSKLHKNLPKGRCTTTVANVNKELSDLSSTKTTPKRNREPNPVEISELPVAKTAKKTKFVDQQDVDPQQALTSGQSKKVKPKGLARSRRKNETQCTMKEGGRTINMSVVADENQFEEEEEDSPEEEDSDDEVILHSNSHRSPWQAVRRLSEMDDNSDTDSVKILPMTEEQKKQ